MSWVGRSSSRWIGSMGKPRLEQGSQAKAGMRSDDLGSQHSGFSILKSPSLLQPGCRGMGAGMELLVPLLCSKLWSWRVGLALVVSMNQLLLPQHSCGWRENWALLSLGCRIPSAGEADGALQLPYSQASRNLTSGIMEHLSSSFLGGNSPRSLSPGGF